MDHSYIQYGKQNINYIKKYFLYRNLINALNNPYN